MSRESGKTLYAHTTKNGDPSEWEPLNKHLENVAALAAKNAQAFGGAEWAAISGFLHDLGKVKPRFQAKLYGPWNDEPHSGEGARFLAEKANGFGPMGKLVAYGIAGHHSGMANGTADHASGPTPLKQRLANAERVPLPNGLDLPTPPNALPKPLKDAVPAGPDQNLWFHFRCQFFARMVFSALVDADRIATGQYYDSVENRKPEPRDRDGSLADLAAALDAHLAKFDDRSGDINALRAHILTHVRAGAAQAPGLFSLSVPTGGGKTLASLAFALDHARKHGLRRVIYVIPYTSIVDQTADVFRNALGDDTAILEHHSAFDWEGIDDHAESERLKLAAENWDRPIIVTTAVQFFESLWSNRPGKCRKLHNIARSVIVLDEAQTLPLALLQPSLAAIGELARGYGCSAVLCTATQPAVSKDAGFGRAALTDVRELAPEPEKLHAQMKRVTVRDGGTMDDDALAQVLRANAQILMIVNTRRHARELYETIKDTDGAVHLTTSMTAPHRRDVLADVRGRLKEKQPVRVVATSLVEAGVDVDFPTVYRAIAGLDSIAQAAGRCNREGSCDTGDVVVFRPADEGNTPKSFKPLTQVTEEVLEDFPDDPFSRDAIEHYFRTLFWDQERLLDQKKILDSIKHAASVMDYNFADWASEFAMIESRDLPVIVTSGAYGVPDDLADDLQHTPHAGTIARKLQPYQVQVPRGIREKMLAQGAASYWRSDEFDKQFVFLCNDDVYDEQAGLRWEEFADIGYKQF